MSDKTPSPQSVVVPVEPTEAMLNAVRPINGRSVWSAMLAAAPAPSSLAGGEKLRSEAVLLAEVLRSRGRSNSKFDIIRASNLLDMLAALSPEAPARDGVEKALDEALIYIEQLGANIERNDLDMHLDAIERPFSFAQTLRGKFPSLCSALTPRHEAPAEGAGEREEAFCEAYYQAHLDHAWTALRDGKPYQVNSDGAISLIQQAAADRRAVKAWQMTARSSAPEAREGEAWGWALKTSQQPWSESKQAVWRLLWNRYGETSEEAAIVTDLIFGLSEDTHPAAPSADKLRIAVEAWAELAKRHSWEISFSGFDEEDGWSVHRVTGGVNDREWKELSRADTPLEAIEAALKAEGAK